MRFEIKVNNSINAKTFLICFIFGFVIFLICMYFTLTEYMEYKDYITIKAEVVDSVKTYNNMSDSYDHKIEFIYNYDENEYKQVEYFTFDKKIEKKFNIKVNPNNPNEYECLEKRNIIWFIDIMLFFWELFIFKCYKIRKGI